MNPIFKAIFNEPNIYFITLLFKEYNFLHFIVNETLQMAIIIIYNHLGILNRNVMIV